jgi:CubicO group peptidase (beta-lactamase class C family)
MRTFGALAVSVVLLTGLVSARQNPSLDSGSLAFESYLELLRQQTGIPAISGVLMQDGIIVWERGLGFANVEARLPARPDTPYLVSDLTQVFSAVLLLQCVEQRRLYLDEPLRTYGARVTDGGATLREVLSHTAGPEGTFRYDPERYAQLTTVMEYCAAEPFRKSVAHRLLERLAMVDSVPGRDFQNPNPDPE